MRKTCRLLAVVVVLLLVAGGAISEALAQGGPDLRAVNMYTCRTWSGTINGQPANTYRTTFTWQNASPVAAIPRVPPVRAWIIPHVEVRCGGGICDSWRPGMNVVQDLTSVPAWGRYNVVATYTVIGEPLYHKTVGAVDTLGVVNESDEGNNAILYRSIPDASINWCPGRAPRVHGLVFKDLNRNGRRDRGEPGVPGVIVQLWQGGRFVSRTTSGWDGAWSIAVDRSGAYSIVAIVPRNVARTLGGGVSWTTPSRYFGVPLTGGSTGPYRFGLAAMPPPPPAEKPIEPRPEASIGWGTAVTRPVVVGQDPDRRGADVFVTIRVRPATYIWYEFNPARGRWERKQAAVTDYVDLNSIRLTATLTAQSRAWIQGELAARYPGARVRRPFWNLRAQPSYRIVRDQVLADGTHEVVIAVTRIPFEDPGMYDVRFAARTTGTSWPGSRVSDPNYLVKPAATSTGAQDIRVAAPLKVWLLDTTLAY